ncbi:MAG TPA: hypothetical protein VMT20_08920 [Terriglobia bacterium]|nr:hypothetical protein [Terriglobia bacterium]
MIGLALAVLSVLVSFRLGWLSYPQPGTAKALGELPPSSVKDLALFIVSVCVPIVFLGAAWWWDIHLRLEGISNAVKSRDAFSGGELLHKDKWNILTIQSAMGRAKPNDHVRIWTSFFVNEFLEISEMLPKLLDAGINFDIMMLNPANDGLLRSRFRLRNGFTDNPPEEARRRIQHQIKMLRDMTGHSGKVEVRECDTMPFGVFYQIGGEVMLIGLFMSLDSWQEGPLMKWYPGSTQWEVFERTWQECWNNPLDAVKPTTSPAIMPGYTATPSGGGVGGVS